MDIRGEFHSVEQYYRGENHRDHRQDEGGLQRFPVGDKSAFALVPEYASDGAHLNPAGRRRVAEQLLVFLADVASRR